MSFARAISARLSAAIWPAPQSPIDPDMIAPCRVELAPANDLRHAPEGFPFPVWSDDDLTRYRANKCRKVAPMKKRPLYGPEFNHRPLTKTQAAKALARADELDDTPRHAPPEFETPVWSDRDIERARIYRDANVTSGRGAGAGALKAKALDLKPWQKRALAKAAKMKGGNND